jgi:hypothetical protein
MFVCDFIPIPADSFIVLTLMNLVASVEALLVVPSLFSLILLRSILVVSAALPSRD